jgi:hypothetical protein
MRLAIFSDVHATPPAVEAAARAIEAAARLIKAAGLPSGFADQFGRARDYR